MAARWTPARKFGPAVLALLLAGCGTPPPLPELADQKLIGRQQETLSDALRARDGSFRVRREETDLWLEHRLAPGEAADSAEFFGREIQAMTTAALMSSTALTVRYQVQSPEGEPLWTLSARRRDLVDLAAGRLPGEVFLLRLDWERGGGPVAQKKADEDGLVRWAAACGLQDTRVIASPPHVYLVSPDADRAWLATARLSAYVAWAAGVAERAPEVAEAVVLSVREVQGADGKKREVTVGRLRVRGKDLRELAAGRSSPDLVLERIGAEESK